MATVALVCEMCQKPVRFTIADEKIPLLNADVRRDLLIQDAFPELDRGIRELMISGTCSKCFDSLFKEE